MFIHGKKPYFVLFLGDIAVFIFSLWVTLLIRYFHLPATSLFLEHLTAFALLFLPWVAVYVVLGLYDHHAALSRGGLFRRLLRAQAVNIIIAIIYFYFFGNIGISPKTNLLLYLFVSSTFILIWRLNITLFVSGIRKERALLIGRTPEVDLLSGEVEGGLSYRYSFTRIIDLDKQSVDADAITAMIKKEGITIVVLDFNDHVVRGVLPDLYRLLFAHVYFVPIQAVYESVFSKMPLRILDYEWFLENISGYEKRSYDSMKRVMDIVIAFPLALLSLIIYPFVFIAIKLDDGGPMFIFQERIGKDNTIIRIPKLRSMKTSDKGVWVKEQDTRITRVGRFLRKSRIDELPQLFSVLMGDLSLVGPRPDICDLGKTLAGEIPYYALRAIIKPGLSGWAQVRQAIAPQSLEETKDRLAYDFYYLKHRSFMLDIKIALQTIATLASRAGR